MDPINIKVGQIDEYFGRATGKMFETTLHLHKQGSLAGFEHVPFNNATRINIDRYSALRYVLFSCPIFLD